ncbi:LysM peptidoglycan-binding domain-containing protein [Pseudobacteroides cellulosolvens]|uniref:LysM peptidoglycan-binding domain-containing protein n=1 Tax=Pseudobacteroides cellulosolvens TaxID=35825 RepID=UPI00068A4B31|nr:LysM domain-containing protein [Pseudobacteroides cellulosolvens]
MPPGVNTYSVQPGDSIFSISQKYRIPSDIIINANGIARKYNVTFNGQPRPDYIIRANPGIAQNIIPGIQLSIPYPPPVGWNHSGTSLNILQEKKSGYMISHHLNIPLSKKPMYPIPNFSLAIKNCCT